MRRELWGGGGGACGGVGRRGRQAGFGGVVPVGWRGRRTVPALDARPLAGRVSPGLPSSTVRGGVGAPPAVNDHAVNGPMVRVAGERLLPGHPRPCTPTGAIGYIRLRAGKVGVVVGGVSGLAEAAWACGALCIDAASCVPLPLRCPSFRDCVG